MPNLNEIKMKRYPNASRKMIWLSCPKCGAERWVQLGHAQRTNFNALCAICNRHHHTAKHHRTNEHPNWKGGRTIHNGYVCITLHPDDFFYPMARKGNIVAEHRLVMAKHLGRCLHRWELVHHKNHIKDDNRIENLQLITDTRHNQITILEKRIIYLQGLVLSLGGEP